MAQPLAVAHFVDAVLRRHPATEPADGAETHGQAARHPTRYRGSEIIGVAVRQERDGDHGKPHHGQTPVIGGPVVGQDSQHPEEHDERAEAEGDSLPDLGRTSRESRYHCADADTYRGPANP